MRGDRRDGGTGRSRIRRLARLAVNQVVAHGFDDVFAVLSVLRREMMALFGGRAG